MATPTETGSTQTPPECWEKIKTPPPAWIVHAIGLVITSIALGCINKPAIGLMVFGLGCICVTVAGRLVLAGTALLATTAYGIWKFAAWMIENPNLQKPQAVVLVAVVIGWCSLIIAALYFLSKRDDDTWR